ncbi:hypothetical protein [Roseovarius salinarum]
MSLFPGFGGRSVPVRIKLALALAFTARSRRMPAGPGSS